MTVPEFREDDLLGRCDPVDGDVLRRGEQAFVCTRCRKGYRPTSWRYLGQCVCGSTSFRSLIVGAPDVAGTGLHWQEVSGAGPAVGAYQNVQGPSIARVALLALVAIALLLAVALCNPSRPAQDARNVPVEDVPVERESDQPTDPVPDSPTYPIERVTVPSHDIPAAVSGERGVISPPKPPVREPPGLDGGAVAREAITGALRLKRMGDYLSSANLLIEARLTLIQERNRGGFDSDRARWISILEDSLYAVKQACWADFDVDRARLGNAAPTPRCP